MFLKQFVLKSSYRGISPFSIEFRDGLNLLVGENGFGKSSILDLISNPGKNKEIFHLASKPCNFKYFNTEKDNPRIRGSLDDSKNPGFQLLSHFTSHGETIFALMKSSEKFKNFVIIIDEPEAGISLLNQKKMLNSFKKAIKNNCQFIVATHSYPIIKSEKETFSMDKKIWISSKEYLEFVGIF